DSFVAVVQQQLSAIFEVAIGYVDKRLTEVCERKEHLLLHALPVPIGDFINAALGIELICEEPPLVAELFSEERVNERDVIVHTPRFKNLFAAEPQACIPLALGDIVIALVIILAEFSTVP